MQAATQHKDIRIPARLRIEIIMGFEFHAIESLALSERQGVDAAEVVGDDLGQVLIHSLEMREMLYNPPPSA